MNVQPRQLPTETHKHTPGPWGIRSRHESRMDHTTVIRSVAIPGHDYIEVSRITNPSPEQDEVARANVRLIAAAPDLLEALKRLLANFSGGTEATHEPGCGCVWHEAAKAIAKSEGRS